jgi:putative nucleotidyltransferase with HDIG domain
MISASNIFPLYYNTGIVVRLVNQSMREVVVNDISRIWSVEQSQDFLSQIAKSGKQLRMEKADPIVEILHPLIPVNLTFNEPATRKRIALAESSAQQMQFHLEKGQVLVRTGEQITETHVELAAEIERRLGPISSIHHTLFMLILFVLVCSVLLRVELTSRSLWNSGLKDALFFAVICVLELGAVRLAYPLLDTLIMPLSPLANSAFLLPAATGAIIIHLMLGAEVSHLFSILMAVCLAFFVGRSFSYGLWVLLTCWAAIHAIRSCRQRTDLYKCGLWAGCVGSLLVLAFLLSDYGLSVGFGWEIWFSISLPFLSGIFSAALVSSFVPVLEALFGYTTSLKLLELSNFNHPLLHALMLKSPGTYHHSVIVGSLAEIAADKIKADALLARVSAYYHDIGKMLKPLYFIENQSLNDNPHEFLAPTMSAKVLVAHVKDGARMAREHNLGDLVIRVIEQHHGTTLINYFFNKAKKCEQPSMDVVDENQFRYPGPKPQTKEAAVVMICDACEAATRSITEPTASKIQTMTHSIVEKRYLDGQFDDCDLTLANLRVIEDCVSRTLISLYHHRIEYPGQKKILEINSSSARNR